MIATKIDEDMISIHCDTYLASVWRRPDVSNPIVVVQPLLDCQLPPDAHSPVLANSIMRRLLGFNANFSYFETSVRDDNRRTYRVYWTKAGHKLRPWLCDPVYTPVCHQSLLHALGCSFLSL